MENDEYLTYKEVAARLKITVPTVKYWVKIGKLTPRRYTCRTVRVLVSDLERLAAEKPH